MAHWKDAAVTNSGVEMLNEWMAGRKLTITGAYGGTGTVEPDALKEQTGLVDLRQKLSLMGQENDKTGVLVQVQVNNVGVTAEYELDQVMVMAALDRDKDPNSEEKCLFIMQDQKGVDVPAEDDEVFLLELYCAIGITNNGRFKVTVDPTGLVSMSRMEEAVQKAVTEHDADQQAHPSLTARVRGVEIALNGGETISGNGAPTVETVGQKGQHYINSVTGEEFVCTNVTESGCVWEPAENIPTALSAKQDKLTGTPGQLAGFDEAGNLTARSTAAITGENLLDNAYWATRDAIINQRGQTAYTGAVYGIDRWRSWETENTVTVHDGYITLSRQLAQEIENGRELLSGKVVTISALTYEGKLLTRSGRIDASKAGILLDQTDINLGNIIIYHDDIGRITFQINVFGGGNTAINAVAAKLELGSVQTLAHQDASGNWVLNDPPPALELAKCKRYLQVIKPPGGQFRYGIDVIGYANNRALGTISLDSEMRAKPTLIVSGDLALWNGEDPISIVDISVITCANNTVNIDVAAAHTDAGATYQVMDQLTGNSMLIFDANL